ncbi:uncharacterized protein TRIADDRAFT_23396 [Trichoplax adhaerens]|uniref:Transcription initiation factor TFIID subunit 6 n=1 Tax=Trichoplax adhaerens TaxID=10228 RepID=B3RTY3_TRIAD|nr:hypothetical protein TRIADDRAFT_23396 [Trichoplax adhaerens]EDV26215.1 hypothetical protein TRIADDRAFT_23396 [Trichoplax adhaerens]|eukprot:XP_002112248.1 hypothetical protein TRIADDRAFT_23396 [Trichoplax adhaerens]
MSEINSSFSKQSVQAIAESCGVMPIEDDCYQVIADEVSANLKAIIQDSMKFMRHSRRSKLTPDDIDLALKLRNREPLYGFTSRDFVPFRYASGQGRRLHFQPDEELNLTEFLESLQVPQVPIDSYVRSHWLSVEGTQPLIQENPDPGNDKYFKL